jgi:hypothetical protein
VGAPKPVKRNRENGRDQDNIIDPVHENRSVNA